MIAMRASHRAKACLAALCVVGFGNLGHARAQQPAISTPPPDATPSPLPNLPPAETPQLPPPPTVVMATAEADVLPSGRLARIRCGGQSIVESLCRYGDFTGIATTYYPSGSVAESLTFSGGLLEGLVESYDPVGHLLSRRLFHLGQPLAAGQNVSQVSLAKDPPLPPPPGFVQSSTPSPASPEESAPAVPPRAPTPDFYGVVGIGAALDMGLLANSAVSPFGIGGHVTVIPNTGRLRPEFRAGSLYFSHNEYRRVDVPLSLGLQFDLIAAPSTVYLGIAMATQYSHRFLPTDIPGPSAEDAWLLGGEAALGLRVQRSSQSYWLFDVRMGGGGRVDSKPQILIPQTDGPPRPAVGGQFQLLLGLTFVGLVGA